MSTSARGFTIIEMAIALACSSVLVIGAISLTSTLDRANTAVQAKVEIEHSCQSTMNYIQRELETATAFYFDRCTDDSIAYRRPDNTYSQLRLADGQLVRDEWAAGADPFPALGGGRSPDKTETIADGIIGLSFRYTVDGWQTPDSYWDQSKFYVIHVTITAAENKATASLQSAVTTVNIIGETGVDSNEVI